MLSRLRARWADERGVAIITAMLVSMVVLTLGVTSVTLALHNTEESAYDRRRVQSVAAAEAGINYYFSHLQSVPAGQFECQIDGTLSGTPSTAYSASVEFFDAAGNEMECEDLTDASLAASAVIRSEGTSGSQTTPTRIMEAYVTLTPQTGAALTDEAIWSYSDPLFNSDVVVSGDGAENADVYTRGNVLVNSEGTIHGDVVSGGWVKLNSYGTVTGDVWARDYVEVISHSEVMFNATSSDSYIYLNSESHVHGDAKAAAAITENGGSVVHGDKIPNDPLLDDPPVEPFPTFTYSASDWAGYTISTYSDCGSAESFIRDISDTDKHLVRITSTCTLDLNNSSDSINVRGDLAIVTDGSISLNSGAGFTNVESPHTLHLFAGHGQTNYGNCSYNIELNSDAYIGSDIQALLHTPCKIILNSQSFAIEGQLIGGKVELNSAGSIGYGAIDVPGTPGGLYDEDIVYIREVAV